MKVTGDNEIKILSGDTSYKCWKYGNFMDDTLVYGGVIDKKTDIEKAVGSDPPIW